MKIITPQAAQDLLLREDSVLIDVREKEEYEAESIAHCQHIPLATLSFDKLPAEKTTFIFQCRLGKRSEQACLKILSERPDLEVFSLEGGIEQWKAQGYPVLSKQPLSLQRQTQIAIGVLLLFWVALGFTLHQGFFLIVALMGLGLIYAGVSNTCTLTLLIKQLPFNQK